jgi:hypothetical protein
MSMRFIAGAAFLLIAGLALQGCSSGGGSSGTLFGTTNGGTTVVLESSQDAVQGTFAFTLTNVRIQGAGGFDASIDPFTTNRNGFAYGFDGAGNNGHVLGGSSLPPGTYHSVTLTYEDARVILPSGEFFANPSFGTLSVALRGPVTVAADEGRAIALTLDLASTFASALAQTGTFQPVIFGRCLCQGETIPLTEFDGTVVSVNHTRRWLTVQGVAKNRVGASVPFGNLAVHVGQKALAINTDDVAAPVGARFAAIASVNGESVEIDAVLMSDGILDVNVIEQDNVGFQGDNDLQVEGVITAIHDNNGEPEFTLFVTRVEDDDFGITSGQLGSVNLSFASTSPRVYFEDQQIGAPATRLRVGMVVEVEGFLENGTRPRPSTPPAMGPILEIGGAPGTAELDEKPLRNFTASSVDVRSQFLAGTINGLSADGTIHASVRSPGLPAGVILDDVRLGPEHVQPLVDGLLPISSLDVPSGANVFLYGSYVAFPESGGVDPFGISGGSASELPENNTHRNFDARYLFVRGAEFGGESVFLVDQSTWSFTLIGDGRPLGLSNPATVKIQVPPDVRTRLTTPSASALGLSRAKIFQQLQLATSVTLRGYLDRKFQSPVFFATSLEVER